MSNLNNMKLKSGKWRFLILVSAIFFFALTFYLFLLNFKLKKEILEIDKKKEEEFSKRILKEREFIKRDLDEKYRADLVSFEAMHRRLEIEKQRTKELQERINKLSSAGPSSPPNPNKESYGQN